MTSTLEITVSSFWKEKEISVFLSTPFSNCWCVCACVWVRAFLPVCTYMLVSTQTAHRLLGRVHWKALIAAAISPSSPIASLFSLFYSNVKHIHPFPHLYGNGFNPFQRPGYLCRHTGLARRDSAPYLFIRVGELGVMGAWKFHRTTCLFPLPNCPVRKWVSQPVTPSFN